MFVHLTGKLHFVVQDTSGKIRINDKGVKKMKHPYDRHVFFTVRSDRFLSLNGIQHLARAGKLSAFDLIYDVNGGSFTLENIVFGKSPKWAMTAEHDPMLYGLPSLSEAELAAVDEMVSEDGFLEMPSEPKVKTIKDFLASEPRIARLVADAEYSLF